MKISAEKKRQMLLDSFELLKDNYKDNRNSLTSLPGKMAKIDLPAAVEMWKYLIKNNPGALHNECGLAFSVWYGIEKAIGREASAKIVIEDDFLKKSIYGECGDLDCCPIYAIEPLILKGKLSTANEILQLISSNKYKKQSMYSILDDILDDIVLEVEDNNVKVTEEEFEFLDAWISKIRSKAERTKLNLKMMDFVEDDE